VPESYTRAEPQTYRLCCAHTHSPALEEIFFNKRLHEQISFLFGEPAIAVQTLYFEYGSRQGLHRDTSVVSYNPLSHLLAAWVALEDIEEGSGELEYIPGSHRIENFFYPDGSIIWRNEYGPDAFSKMDQGIRDTAGHHQLRPERFLARQGQALIWHHSLAHGGAPVTKAATTRKSLVIHFTTLADFTRRYHQLIYKDRERGEYRIFVDSSAEVIERDGCYASASVIRGWQDRPLPPTKRATVKSGAHTERFNGAEVGAFIKSEKLGGWVDGILTNDKHGGIVISGWALNFEERSPASHVALVAEDGIVSSWPTGTLRNDVGEVHGTKDAAYAGFYNVVPFQQVSGRQNLRIYALDDQGGFAELNYTEQVAEVLLQLSDSEQAKVA
jgi:hypothetical protein